MKDECSKYSFTTPNNEHIKTVSETLMEVGRRRYNEVMSQREEILKAFIAKHGCQPEECVQEICRGMYGDDQWHVRKMTDDEKKRFLGDGI
jgi:hypothetical protein